MASTFLQKIAQMFCFIKFNKFLKEIDAQYQIMIFFVDINLI